MLANSMGINSENMWGRVVFLLLLSMVLCSFVPSSIFAAVPVAILFLSYGDKLAGAATAIAFLILLFLASSGGLTITVALLYVAVVFFGYVASAIIKRGITPSTGLYIIGFSALAILFVLWAGMTIIGQVSVEQQVDQIVKTALDILKQEKGDTIASATSQEGMFLKEILEKPEILTKQIMSWLPAMVIISTFFTAWITLMLVLRNSIQWSKQVEYAFSTKDLISFRAPEYFVYPLIISLGLALGSDVIGLGETGEIIAFNVLYSIGIFYFFQGFGVYIDFLNFMNIHGVMRTILIVMTIVMANRMLVFIGMFDLWINFRKFLKKKNKEGDIS